MNNCKSSWEVPPDEKRNKSLVVVIYDVSNDKRRTRIGKVLESYGFRVQRSAFECLLTKRGYEKMVKRLENIIAKDDMMRIYKLTKNADVRIWGKVKETKEDDVVII